MVHITTAGLRLLLPAQLICEFVFPSMARIEYKMSARILLVDDERSIVMTLTAILQKNGFQVTSAASAREAKEKLAGNKFDLVITDLKMETDGAGFEVVKAALEQPYKPATLLLTAYPVPPQEWATRGADGLLEKPTEMSALLETISHLLSAH
jgi:CheY-like chemotaxis protein